MPELPEVEASRALIQAHCAGRTVTAVTAADDTKVFDGAAAADVAAAFRGRVLLGAGRKGKQLWLLLSGNDGPNVLMHFGMTGYIAVKDDAQEGGKVHVLAYENAPHETSSWPPRFHKLLLSLGPRPGEPAAAACHFAFCDARRFGKVKLVQGDPAVCEAVAVKLGFDPLTAMPSQQDFQELLRARATGATRLKPLLLDQSFCAGVGNWVADEVLWHARLHPQQLVSALADSHIAALHAALKVVVDTAVAVDADASRFPPDWMFHVRWGKRAGQLCGHKLDFITVGARTSCFVPALQKIVGRASEGAQAAAAKRSQQHKNAQKKRAAAAADAGGSSDSDEQQQPSEEQRAGGGNAVKPAARKRRAAAPTAGSSGGGGGGGGGGAKGNMRPRRS